MGLLDDAIREHLELKRRHGAAEEEVRRLEEEALGPVRSAGEYAEPAAPAAAGTADQPAPPTAEGDAPAYGADDQSATRILEQAPPEPVEPAPEPGAALPAPAADAPPPDPGSEAAAPPAEAPASTPPAAAVPGAPEAGLPAGPRLRPVRDEPPVVAADEPRLEEPHEVPAEEALDRDQPTAEFAPPEVPPRDTAPGEDVLQETPGEDVPGEMPPGEDVLEETPEFLQETPEHDRLWFEQKPPRDFDFDK